MKTLMKPRFAPLYLLFWLLWMPVGAKAQEKDFKTLSPAFVRWDVAWQRTLPHWKKKLQWVVKAQSQPWTESDAPFLTIGREIDRKLKDRADFIGVEEFYRQQAQAQPDAVNNYAWGYSVLRRYKAVKSPFRSLFPALTTLQNSPYAPSFQYTKLLFSLQKRDFNNPKVLEPVAQRLLKRSPNDATLQLYTAELLGKIPTQAARQQSLALMQKLIKRRPSEISYWSQLADVYDNWWGWDIHTSRIASARRDGDAALAAYRKTISLSPPNSPWRGEIGQMLMDRIIQWKRKHPQLG